MNKSTPINQLPSFVNDQQRQIVTNAQQAIGSINLPQNTQNQPELGDDDVEIQEALNDVNAQLHPQPQPQPIMRQMMPEQHEYPTMPNIPIENHDDIMYMQGRYQHPQMLTPPAPAPAPALSKKDWFSASDLITRFSDDLKLAAIIAAAVAVVHFIPFDSIIGKYFALEKVPYHDVILRAVFAAVIVLVIKNVIA